jgi:hypothetical protein
MKLLIVGPPNSAKTSLRANLLTNTAIMFSRRVYLISECALKFRYLSFRVRMIILALRIYALKAEE